MNRSIEKSISKRLRFRPNHAKVVAGIVLLPTAMIGLSLAMGLTLARTPSLPPGVYRLTHNTQDPLISFCPTGAVSQESSARHYRESAITCPDHFAPLLKPIVARAGDLVTVTRKEIAVNGIALPRTKQFLFDRQHLPMHPWPEGEYRVEPGTVWVISTYNVGSYDSRYYGPIKLSDVLRYGHPVWQFTK